MVQFQNLGRGDYTCLPMAKNWATMLIQQLVVLRSFTSCYELGLRLTAVVIYGHEHTHFEDSLTGTSHPTSKAIEVASPLAMTSVATDYCLGLQYQM